MKKITLSIWLSALLSLIFVGTAVAHNSGVTISSPLDGAEIVVDSLPTNVTVQGTITHSPGTVNDFRVCVTLDGAATTCEPNYLSGLGSATSRNYSINIAIDSAGEHMLQASTANSSGDHSGISDLFTITITYIGGECDEKDPPAYANEYLNSLDLPQSYATYRGLIIQFIALNHSVGAYGSCYYDYDAVKDDVDYMLWLYGF